ncbi:MAG: hypothetical protein E6J70_16080 [Deltaproteobacteria bacterium]|jgi:hypothetical protein|nr:MAG: hypothetical protein E6J70_16080 [Deltaproteobacteria bacterium]
MARIDLKPEEARMLREVLESYLSDLRMEIAGTESVSFRENLKKTEAFLKELIPRLREPA